MSREGEGKMDKEKRCLGKEGNYDYKKGSSAMADGCRVRNGLSLRPTDSKMVTTMDRLLAYFFSSSITVFLMVFLMMLAHCFGVNLHKLLAPLRLQQ